MLDKEILNQYRNDAQGLARYFSEQYFKEHEKVFPINPFQVLTDLGIHFVFRNFDKMEGLFMPSTADMPIDLVAINAKRPITRQRFSAAHELCHFLKDADTQSTFMCAISSNEYKEKYAESFAASFLMPEDELCVQIDSLLNMEIWKQKNIFPGRRQQPSPGLPAEQSQNGFRWGIFQVPGQERP